jgi:hypothetical protein
VEVLGVEIRPVVEFPSSGYWVGEDGSFWTNCPPKRGFGRGDPVWRRLATHTRPRNGYVTCSFRPAARGKVVTRYLHDLVLEAFAGPRPDGFQCLHGVGGPSDNRIGNLLWGTAKANSNDPIHLGRLPRGDRHHNAKLNRNKVAEIRREYAAGGVTQKELAKRYEISQSAVSLVVRGVLWKAL